MTDTMKQPQNILELSAEEQKNFINSFDIILTDCDGVLWSNKFNCIINDIGLATSVLQKNGKQIFYVSNNSLRNNHQYLQKFKDIGIDSTVNDILHPAIATAFYLKKNHFKGLIYIIGSDGFKQILKEAGYEIIDGPYDRVGDNFSKFFKSVADGKPVKCVIVDTDFDCSVLTLARAEMYLKDPECIFIAGSTDMMLPVGDNFSIIGPGPYYKIIEEASGRKAKVVGKPGDALVDICLDKFNIKDKNRVLFIGDMLEQDIKFGKKCGFRTLLVLTGGTTKEAMENHEYKNELPDYYLNSFADFTKIYNEIEVKNKL